MLRVTYCDATFSWANNVGHTVSLSIINSLLSVNILPLLITL